MFTFRKSRGRESQSDIHFPRIQKCGIQLGETENTDGTQMAKRLGEDLSYIKL